MSSDDESTTDEGTVAPYKPLDRLRFDVIQEVIGTDPVTGTVEIAIRPDPRRYDIREGSHGREIFDRYDRTVMAWDLFEDMVQRALAMQALAQPQQVGSADEYVADRLEKIRRRLKESEPSTVAPTQGRDFLADNAGTRFAGVGLSCDMVGSTRLGRRVDVAHVARVKQVLLDELSRVVPLFNGYVLAYTGDGLLAFFPEPNLTNMADLAVDCALTCRKLVRDAISPALTEIGLPPIEVRQGLEAGEAIVTAVGDESAKREYNLVGDFLDMSSKLQSIASPGAIYVGYLLERNLHIGWRERLVEVEPPASWTYVDDRGLPFRIFSLDPP